MGQLILDHLKGRKTGEAGRMRFMELGILIALITTLGSSTPLDKSVKTDIENRGWKNEWVRKGYKINIAMSCKGDSYNKGKYSTLDEARTACTYDSNCKGVQDTGCFYEQNKGDKTSQKGLSLCPKKQDKGKGVQGKPWYFSEENDPSCIHKKPDTSCIHTDAIFTQTSMNRYDVTKNFCAAKKGVSDYYWLQGENCGFKGMTLLECQHKCATADSRFGGCTHFMYYRNTAVTKTSSGSRSIDYLTRTGDEDEWHCDQEWSGRYSCNAEDIAPLSSCYLFNGQLQMKQSNTNQMKKFGVSVGTAFCEEDKKKIRAHATAKWVRLQICDASTATGSLTCSYTKATGIGKEKSSSNSKGGSTSWEFGYNVGFEKDTKFMKMTLEQSMAYGESYEWSKENSKTFSETADISVTGTFTVNPGEIASICQPQGSVGEYVIYSSYFKRVHGTDCEGGSKRSAQSGVKAVNGKCPQGLHMVQGLCQVSTTVII